VIHLAFGDGTDAGSPLVRYSVFAEVSQVAQRCWVLTDHLAFSTRNR
jgi:hypothetical protein